MKLDLRAMDLEELQEMDSILKAQKSFYEFFKQAWVQIEGINKPYIDNWHIQCYCEHLQAVYEGDIRYLLINAPPRSAKSNVVDVAFLPWVWTKKPHISFLFAAHSHDLAKRDSGRSRDLMLSDWYQKRWGHTVKITKATEETIYNSSKGHRIITSPTSRVTGQGGDIIVADDLNDMMEVKSDVKRNRVNEWFSSTFSSRINNPKTGAIIVQQQRGHQNDVSGYIRNHDLNNEWVHVMIPMEFEEGRRCSTIVLPSTDGKIWTDPRTQEGELMFGDWFSNEHLENIKVQRGASNYAGQYQQRPAPAEGAIIKRHWFQWWREEYPPNIEYVIQSWDTAFSERKEAAYSACTTWGVWYDDHGLGNVILLSMWRDRVGYPELRAMAKRLYFDYRDKGKTRNPHLTGKKIDQVLIESKATGDPLRRDLMEAGIFTTPYNPTKQGDKIERVHKITQYLESGLVWLPAQAPAFDSLTNEASDFLEDVLYFPNGDSRDLVDTMTQVLRRLNDQGILAHPRDTRPIPSYYDTPIVY